MVTHKNDTDNALFVGSTFNRLKKRWHKLKSAYILYPDTKLNKYIRERGGIDLFKLVLLEEREFQNTHKMQLRAEYFRKKLKPPLNLYACSRGNKSIKKYQQDYNQIYRTNNKASIAKRVRAKVACACGTIVCSDSLPRHKRTKTHKNRMKIKNNAATLIDGILKSLFIK